MLLLDQNKNPGVSEPLFDEAFQDRFWRKVEIAGPEDCWMWKASVGSKSKYGHMWCYIGGRKTCRDSHTIAWMIANGPIPKSLRH